MAVERRDRGDRRLADLVRDGQAGQAGQRSGRRPLGGHRGAGDGGGRAGAAPGGGLLPPDGRLRGAHVRRGQDPRRLHQARGRARATSHPDRAPDRPADPAALPQGLPQRRPDRRDRRCRSTRRTTPTSWHHRRLGGADDLGHPVPRPGRRGAGRPDRRRVRDQPDRCRSWRRVELDLVVAGTAEAIADGRGRRQGAARGRRCSRPSQIGHEEIQPLSDAQHRAGQAGRQAEARVSPPPVAEKLARQGRDEAFGNRAAPRPPRPGPSGPRRQGRRASEPPRREDRRRTSRRRTTPRKFVRRRSTALQKTVVRRASSTRQRVPTAAARRTSGRSRSRSACCRACTARASSPAAQTQVLTIATLGTTERRAAHRRPRHRDHEALHAPLQLPAVQRRRDRLHARPEPARDRPRRAGRARAGADDARRGEFPYTHAARLRDRSSRTARPRWPSVCGSTLALHGRRRADQARRSPASRWA